MVNVELLRNHVSKYPLNKDTAAEYHKQLFTLHPELAEFYNADGCDPDSIPKNRKFIMMGQHELQLFFRLPDAVSDERKWRGALSGFKENSEDVGFPLEKFNQTTDAFLAAMKTHAGGVNAEQKQQWEEILGKAYVDMKSFGWY